MEFNLRKSQIFKAVLFARSFHPAILRIVRSVSLAFAFLAFILWWLAQGSAFSDVFGFNFWLSADLMLGIVYLFAPIGLTVLFFELFFKFYLQFPTVKDKNNIAEYLTYDAAMLLYAALSYAAKKGDKNFSPDNVLAMLASSKEGANIFTRLDIDPGEFKGINDKNETSFTDFAEILFKVSRQHAYKKITIADFLPALHEASLGFRKIIDRHNLTREDLNAFALWYENIFTSRQKHIRFWTTNNLLKTKPIGVGWVYGYPRLLAQFARDLTLPFAEGRALVEIVGRKKEKQHLEEILLRGQKQNALFVGDEGSGKKAIIMDLAQDVSLGIAPKGLKDKRILEIDFSAVLGSSNKKAEVQNNLNGVLQEAAKLGNVVVFVEGLHNFVGGEGIGRADITQVMLPYLNSSNLQIIATTDPVNFHKHVRPRTDILGSLEKIEIEELPKQDVMIILENHIMRLEAANKLFFKYGAIKAIYEDAQKYIQDVPFPEKALSLLSEVASYMRANNKNVVNAQDVHEVVTRKTEIPLGEIGSKEKQKLMNLENIMHTEIVGQNKAIKTVAETMRRLRAGISREDKPAGVFLFVGPTGVGKTLTAKILAKTQFGAENKMVRFDMSEYQTPESTERLLGSLKTDKPGQLISAVRDNPFSVILLDEFEKAHKEVLNIFLRIFDEGRVKDVFGREVNFENNIIIATSNAGAQYIRQMVQKGQDPSEQKQKLIDLFISEGHFRPELLNRFDEIVIYHPLNKQQIRQIAQLLINKLVERMQEKGYYFKPTTEVIDYITEVGFDPQFGARPMARAIQDKIESTIARRILEDTIKKGEEFLISLDEIKN